MVETVAELARKYALQNAVRHTGKADPKAILGKILGERADLRSRAKEFSAVISTAVEKVNALDPAAQRKQLEQLDPDMLRVKPRAEREGLVHLPGWEEADPIIMRFAPNPNGPATFGHSRGMTLHAEYQRMYEALGKKVGLVLRFDDTDPATKVPLLEAYDSIRRDFEWLGGKPTKVVHASRQLPAYYEAAEELLGKGRAYVCECPAESFRRMKAVGKECEHRSRPPDDAMQAWKRMLDGGYEPGQAVLRVATDMKHSDPALRDWVAFRILDQPHPLVGSKFRVWPLLDFESAIEDHAQGVTHILRGKDLIDSERRQRFVYDDLGWAYPKTKHWGRIQVEGFGKVSKSGILAGVRDGTYSGWDDVRLPTLASLRRRGFQPEAIHAFWVRMGLTEKDVSASMKNLEAENRRVVEPVAKRFSFVADPKPLTIVGLPDDGIDSHAPVHPDRPELGVRTARIGGPNGGDVVLLAGRDHVACKNDDVVRLKDLATVRIAGDGKADFLGQDIAKVPKPGRVLQWCSGAAGATVETSLAHPDDDGTTEAGLAEAALVEAHGDVVQFERVGFARIESVGPTVMAIFSHA